MMTALRPQPDPELVGELRHRVLPTRQALPSLEKIDGGEPHNFGLKEAGNGHRQK